MPTPVFPFSRFHSSTIRSFRVNVTPPLALSKQCSSRVSQKIFSLIMAKVRIRYLFQLSQMQKFVFEYIVAFPIAEILYLSVTLNRYTILAKGEQHHARARNFIGNYLLSAATFYPLFCLRSVLLFQPTDKIHIMISR